jgi:hypothetical protein
VSAECSSRHWPLRLSRLTSSPAGHLLGPTHHR